MIKDNNLRMYEALAHEVAMDAAARRELTNEQRQESRQLLAFAHERLAEMERSRRRNEPRKVRGEVAAMQRASLLGRLGELLAIQPRTVYAFRDLEAMSDDDLRNALEDALSMIERMS
jgi:hypothetical protein